MDHRRSVPERLPILGGVVVVTCKRTRWSPRRRPHPIPPSPRGYPWLGVLPQMRRDSLGFLSAMVRTYGDIVALPFGPVRVYLLCHPEQVAYALFADNVPSLLPSPLRGVNQQVMHAHIGFSGPRSACLASSQTHWPYAISRSSDSAPAYTA